jgi:hypothetical protein
MRQVLKILFYSIFFTLFQPLFASKLKEKEKPHKKFIYYMCCSLKNSTQYVFPTTDNNLQTIIIDTPEVYSDNYEEYLEYVPSQKSLWDAFWASVLRVCKKFCGDIKIKSE